MTDKQELIERVQETIDAGDAGPVVNFLLDDVIAALSDQWISVDERLPESHMDCLVFILAAFPFCSVAKFWRGPDKWLSSDARVTQWQMDVTHWMPLPAPPEKV